MRPLPLFLAFALPTISVSSRADAVTYQYVSPPLISSVGSTLGGHPIIFDFTTYRLLRPNLSFDIIGRTTPFFSAPIIDWSVSIGQYEATGTGNLDGGANGLYFIAFDTDSTAEITNWVFEINPVTIDAKHIISVVSGGGPNQSTIVQVNPLSGPFTDLASTSERGTWSLLDSTIIPGGPPIPEPSTWAMLLAGFAGLSFMGWRAAKERGGLASSGRSSIDSEYRNKTCSISLHIAIIYTSLYS